MGGSRRRQGSVLGRCCPTSRFMTEHLLLSAPPFISAPHAFVILPAFGCDPPVPPSGAALACSRFGGGTVSGVERVRRSKSTQPAATDEEGLWHGLALDGRIPQASDSSRPRLTAPAASAARGRDETPAEAGRQSSAVPPDLCAPTSGAASTPSHCECPRRSSSAGLVCSMRGTPHPSP